MKWLAKIIWDGLSGVIVPFTGAIADIPKGWALCDGTQGTPDLRNRFIACAGDERPAGTEGGQETHYHEFTATPHSHTLAAGGGLGAGDVWLANTDSVAVTGETHPASSLPPFYALAFIMRLP
jgi:hypothetical protein